MKKLLLVCTAFLTLIAQSQTYINENFNGGSLPSGWSVVNNCTACAYGSWTYASTSSPFDPWNIGPWYVDGTTGYMVVRSGTSSQQSDEELLSPVYNAGGASSVILTFDHIYDDFTAGNDHGYVDVYDGSTWQQVADFDSDFGSFTSGTNNPQTIDITTYANSAMQLRFRYINNGVNARWWGVDNVVVTYTASANPPVAGFSSNYTTTCANETVTFSDQSSQGPAAWDWSFTPSAGVTYVGGTSSTSQNPQVTFANTGSYSVTLISSNSNGADTITTSNYLTVTGAPTANAGSDQTICAGTASVTLSGAISNAAGGLWSTAGGGGSFSSSSNMNATYTIGGNDVSNGTVVINLITSGNGGCAAGSDQMIITITPGPTADAGADAAGCESAPIALSGTVVTASGGVWTTTGDGSIASSTSLSTTYTPGATDVSNGTVDLILTTTGNGSCNAGSDTVTYTLESSPTLSINADNVICVDSTASATATVGVVSGGTWSGSGGAISPNATSNTIVYIPSTSEEIAGSATLIFTTDANSCPSVSDTVTISIMDTCNEVVDAVMENEYFNFTVQPNPLSKGQQLVVNLSVNSGQSVNCKLINIIGETVHESTETVQNNQLYLDEISNYQEGVYFLNISKINGNLSQTTRLIIK